MRDVNPLDDTDEGGEFGRVSSSKDESVAVSTVGFDLAANVNYLLRRAHARADALFKRVMPDAGITPRQAALLFAVGARPGCSLTDLARFTGIDRGTIAEMVPRLIRRGLLVQSKASGDARAKSLRCTDAGRLAVRLVNERTPQLRTDVLSALPDEYHELFIKMLRLLVEIEVEVRTNTGAGAADSDASNRTRG